MTTAAFPAVDAAPPPVDTDASDVAAAAASAAALAAPLPGHGADRLPTICDKSAQRMGSKEVKEHAILCASITAAGTGYGSNPATDGGTTEPT